MHYSSTNGDGSCFSVSVVSLTLLRELERDSRRQKERQRETERNRKKQKETTMDRERGKQGLSCLSFVSVFLFLSCILLQSDFFSKRLVFGSLGDADRHPRQAHLLGLMCCLCCCCCCCCLCAAVAAADAERGQKKMHVGVYKLCLKKSFLMRGHSLSPKP